MTSQDQRLQLAIIGCGAITEQGHLPAAMKIAGVRELHLVEKDRARVDRLAQRHGVSSVLSDYKQLFGKVDAAIVALPPALHAPVSIELLERGIHVLVEKPMARTTAECDAMLHAASRSGAKLAVGYVRRFRWAYRWARTVMERGLLGRIESVDVSEGGVFDWPVASPFFLDRQAAGGGVLVDAGVHALDALHWWFGPIKVSSYRDDDMGGVEADCEIDLLLGDDVKAHIELSRTRRMRNTTIIQGEHGRMEIHAFTNELSLQLRDGSGCVSPRLEASSGNTVAFDLHGQAKVNGLASEDIFKDQLQDFIDAIATGRSPLVNGGQGRMATAIVEKCYASRQPLHHPWVFVGMPVSSPADLPPIQPNALAPSVAGGAR